MTLECILVSELLSTFVMFSMLKALLHLYIEILKVFTKFVVSLLEFIVEAFETSSS